MSKQVIHVTKYLINLIIKGKNNNNNCKCNKVKQENHEIIVNKNKNIKIKTGLLGVKLSKTC